VKKKITFKYNPATYTLTLEHETPKNLEKRLTKLLPDKPEFSVNNYTINQDKIIITVPIQEQWRRYLLPDNPTDLDYILLFSDEVLLVLQSMYEGASKLLEESTVKLDDIKHQIRIIEKELRKFEGYDQLSKKVSTELYYYIDSFVKNARQQLYHHKLMKSNLEKEIELYKLIMDSIYTVTMSFATSYPMITVEYNDKDNRFQLNVNGTFIDLPPNIGNVRDVYTTYKNIFISALTVMRSDVIEDINNYQKSIISQESVLTSYQKLLDEVKNNDSIDEKTRKALIKLLKSDIMFLKMDIKKTNSYIKKLKKIEKVLVRTIKEVGGEAGD